MLLLLLLSVNAVPLEENKENTEKEGDTQSGRGE